MELTDIIIRAVFVLMCIGGMKYTWTVMTCEETKYYPRVFFWGCLAVQLAYCLIIYWLVSGENLF